MSSQSPQCVNTKVDGQVLHQFYTRMSGQRNRPSWRPAEPSSKASPNQDQQSNTSVSLILSQFLENISRAFFLWWTSLHFNCTQFLTPETQIKQQKHGRSLRNIPRICSLDVNKNWRGGRRVRGRFVFWEGLGKPTKLSCFLLLG